MKKAEVTHVVDDVFGMPSASLVVHSKDQLNDIDLLSQSVLQHYAGTIAKLEDMYLSSPLRAPKNHLTREEYAEATNLQAEVDNIVIAMMYDSYLEPALRASEQDRLLKLPKGTLDRKLSEWWFFQEAELLRLVPTWLHGNTKDFPDSLARLYRCAILFMILKDADAERNAGTSEDQIDAAYQQTMQDPSGYYGGHIVEGTGTARDVTLGAVRNAISQLHGSELTIPILMALVRTHTVVAYLLGHVPQAAIVHITERHLLPLITKFERNEATGEMHAALDGKGLRNALEAILQEYPLNTDRNPRLQVAKYDRKLKHCPAIVSGALTNYFRLTCDEVENVLASH